LHHQGCHFGAGQVVLGQCTVYSSYDSSITDFFINNDNFWRNFR
jgi:hypothetical protein